MEDLNKQWSEQQALQARQEREFELYLQTREELQCLQRTEIEAKVVNDYALLKRAVEYGFPWPTSYSELDLIRKSQLFWPLSVQSHKCVPECKQFNIPPGEMRPRLDATGEMIKFSGCWWVCMTTGNMHECHQERSCNAMKIVKDKIIGVTIAYKCMISNLSKPKPVSLTGEWNGIFLSSSVARKKENDADNEEKDRIEDGEEKYEEMEDDEAKDEEDEGEEEEEEGEVSNEEEKEEEEEENEEEERMVKLQRVNEATPFTNLTRRYATSNSVDELAAAIAKERLEEQIQFAEKRKREEEARSNNRVLSFGSSMNNKELERMYRALRIAQSLDREKAKGRGDGKKKRTGRRETAAIRTPEQRSERCLAKVDHRLLDSIIEAMTSTKVLNDIIHIKFKDGVRAADRAVQEFRKGTNMPPVIMQEAVWRQKMNQVIGLRLTPRMEYPIDSEELRNIIICHWRLASVSPYVTETLEVHKKKKRKPLDFTLYSIGILYLMGDGGFANQVTLYGSLPEILTKRCNRQLLDRLAKGVTISELPNKKESLGKMLLPNVVFHYLRRVYRDDWLFTENTVNDGIQLVKLCWECRYREEKEKLFAALNALDIEQATLKDIEQVYKAYLTALIPAHSANRQWPTSTSLPTNGTTE